MKGNDASKPDNARQEGPWYVRVGEWYCTLPVEQRVRLISLLVAILVALIGCLATLGAPAVGEVVKKLLASPAPTEAAVLPPTHTTTPTSTRIPSPTPAITRTSSTTVAPTRTPVPTPTSTLVFTPTSTPTPTCTPTPHPPQLVATRLWYSLNDSPEQSVQREDIIRVATGDRLCMVRLEYTPDSTPGPDDTAHGEAYVRKREPGVNSCDDGFDYDDGEFWLGDCVDPGANELANIDPTEGDGCWTIEEGWDRLVVALIHNGEFGCEVDHRFSVHLVQLH